MGLQPVEDSFDDECIVLAKTYRDYDFARLFFSDDVIGEHKKEMGFGDESKVIEFVYFIKVFHSGKTMRGYLCVYMSPLKESGVYLGMMYEDICSEALSALIKLWRN